MKSETQERIERLVSAFDTYIALTDVEGTYNIQCALAEEIVSAEAKIPESIRAHSTFHRHEVSEHTTRRRDHYAKLLSLLHQLDE